MVRFVFLSLVMAGLIGCSKTKAVKNPEGLLKRTEDASFDAGEGADAEYGANGAGLENLTMACTHSENFSSNIIKKNGVRVVTRNKNSVGVARLVLDESGTPTIAIRLLSASGRVLASNARGWKGPAKWPSNWITVVYDKRDEGFTFGCRIVWPGQRPDIG